MQEENKVKRSFFQNLKAELKKVIWPTGKQVVKNTFATIAFVLIITLALVIFNLLFEVLKDKLWYEPIFGESAKKTEKIEETENTTESLPEAVDAATNGEVGVAVPEETQITETTENAEATEVTE